MNCPKHVEFYSKNKFEKSVHLFGFIIRIFHDARSPECQSPQPVASWDCSRIQEDLNSLTLKLLGRYGWSCYHFAILFAFWPSWCTPIGSYKPSVITFWITCTHFEIQTVPWAVYCFSHVLATLLYNSRYDTAGFLNISPTSDFTVVLQYFKK